MASECDICGEPISDDEPVAEVTITGGTTILKRKPAVERAHPGCLKSLVADAREGGGETR